MHRLVQAVIVETLSPELQTQWQKRVEYMDFLSDDLGYTLASMFYDMYEDDAMEELSKVVTFLTPLPKPESDTASRGIDYFSK